MKLLSYLALSAVAATPALAQEARQLDAHEHGVGQLDIAIDGQQIAMELHAPGADIVGFEYEATSDADLAAIEVALNVLAQPLELFVMTQAASCTVVEATAELESEDSHDDHEDEHDHEEHAEDDHTDHDEHAEEEHDDHDHEDHAEEGHDDHDEEGHDDHDDHASEAGHTEFHAAYSIECADPSAITDITFAYFDAFPNAIEVEVQILSESGATAYEVERDAPILDVSDLF